MKFILVLSLSFFLMCNVRCSCDRISKIQQEKRELAQIETSVNTWLGRKIQIDPTVGYLTARGDSDEIELPSVDFRLIRYIDSEGCTSCRMQMRRCRDAQRELSASAATEVGFLYIISPDNIGELTSILARDNIGNLPVLVDMSDSLNRMNGFPEADGLRTFLVDRDNRVLGVGDPAVNPQIMRLYTSILTSDSVRTQRRMPKTSLVMFPAKMDIGRIAAGDSVVGEFHLGNYGDEPFVLDALVPSCECVTAVLSSDTIAPRSEAIMRVVFHEDEPIGSFERSVEVIGNIDPDFALTITGTVVEK